MYFSLVKNHFPIINDRSLWTRFLLWCFTHMRVMRDGDNNISRVVLSKRVFIYLLHMYNKLRFCLLIRYVFMYSIIYIVVIKTWCSFDTQATLIDIRRSGFSIAHLHSSYCSSWSFTFDVSFRYLYTFNFERGTVKRYYGHLQVYYCSECDLGTYTINDRLTRGLPYWAI